MVVVECLLIVRVDRSLGCTVIELITGHPPYHGMNAMAALFKIVADERPDFPEDISEELSGFLFSCLQKEPGDRADAEALLNHTFIRKYSDKKQDLRRYTGSFTDSKQSTSQSPLPTLTQTVETPRPDGEELSVPHFRAYCFKE